MSKYNDINIKEWKNYEEVLTDSLWIIDKRDNTGVHSGHYHGNFVPQIPHQLLTRYTKQGDWVLDPFMGSGTTCIQAYLMNRKYIGFEIAENYFNAVKEYLDKLTSQLRIFDFLEE